RDRKSRGLTNGTMDDQPAPEPANRQKDPSHHPYGGNCGPPRKFCTCWNRNGRLGSGCDVHLGNGCKVRRDLHDRIRMRQRHLPRELYPRARGNNQRERNQKFDRGREPKPVTESRGVLSKSFRSEGDEKNKRRGLPEMVDELVHVAYSFPLSSRCSS